MMPVGWLYLSQTPASLLCSALSVTGFCWGVQGEGEDHPPHQALRSVTVGENSCSLCENLHWRQTPEHPQRPCPPKPNRTCSKHAQSEWSQVYTGAGSHGGALLRSFAFTAAGLVQQGAL